MALLGFGGYKATAFLTMKHAPVGISLQFRPLGLALTRHYSLAVVEQRLGDNRLVLALVDLALIPYNTVVDRVLEHILVVGG
ncbi:MAG: hypothetical protein A2X28_05820 [Elusimicrobia bacterium GWA2_56_46]|nr:MAG: hypothetical protein A2X28_05820 [Elusimicrobia bacterium GWA2_56_46]OGR54342.1 MAG: hypothetical protein A2X39_06390 [Elusimicrobia bacterium GWC2_56_31]HBW22807.1 hypothetical protein [Elusimicrobiota bacterium]